NNYWSWADSTSDVRALQKVNSSSDRIAAAYYSYSNFTYDLNLTDAQVHQIALYCVDYDTQGRVGKIEIFDAANNALLDSQSVSSYSSGKYLVWNIKGHVSIKLSFVSASGAPTIVLSGLFFDPGGSAQVPAPPTNLKATPGDKQVSLSWDASSGASSY